MSIIGQLFATFLSRSKTALSQRKDSIIFVLVVPINVGKGDYKRVFIFSVRLKIIGKGYFKGFMIKMK